MRHQLSESCIADAAEMRRENFIQGRQTEFFFMPVAALEIFLESQGDRGLYASYDFCSSARDWDKQLFGLCV